MGGAYLVGIVDGLGAATTRVVQRFVDRGRMLQGHVIIRALECRSPLHFLLLIESLLITIRISFNKSFDRINILVAGLAHLL